MFAKSIVSFMLIYVYVYMVLCTSTQSYFIFRVQFFEVFRISVLVEYVLSVLRIHLKITEPMSKSGFFLS